jgi:hypothetical protein
VSARFGPFAVDSDRRQLLKSGVDMHLTPKAFDLLVLLRASRHMLCARTNCVGGCGLELKAAHQRPDFNVACQLSTTANRDRSLESGGALTISRRPPVAGDIVSGKDTGSCVVTCEESRGGAGGLMTRREVRDHHLVVVAKEQLAVAGPHRLFPASH